jgi:PAS domain S-box-containing protein
MEQMRDAAAIPADSMRAAELPVLRLLSPVLVADDERCYVAANQLAAELLGLPLEELLGRRVEEFAEERHRDAVVEQWKNFISEGSQRGEFLLQRPDAQARMVEFTAVADFRPGLHVSILRDITESRAAAAALAQSEMRLNFALKAGGMGTWEWDAETNEVYWSESIEAIYGLPPGGFGRTYAAFLALVHPDDREQVASKAIEAASAGRDYTIEFRIVRPDGEVRWIAGRGRSLLDSDGVRRGITGISWDCTDQKTAERERERLAAQLRDTSALLDTLFEQAPVGFGFWDRTLRFARVNRALAEMNGLPAAQHIGKSIDEILTGIDPGALEMFSRVLRDGGPVLHREAAFPETGRYWTVRCYPIRLGGEVAGVGAVCEDITERKRAEAINRDLLEREQAARAEAQAAERRAAFLAAAATVLASSLDTAATLTAVARLAVPRIADWCAIDILDNNGEPQRIAVEHIDSSKVQCALDLDRVLRTGVSEMSEPGPPSCIIVPVMRQETVLGAISLATAEAGVRYAAADLRLAEELANRAAIAIENARLYAAAEQRRAEAEQALDQLRRANAELEQFAFVASHDLQEPLRTIAGFTDLLSRNYKGRLDATADEFITHITAGAGRMRSLITDLLNYSRIIRDEVQPRASVDLNAVLHASLENLSASISESGAEVLSDSLPVIPADRTDMEQLLQNLLSNAIKYRRSGVPPRIRVSVQRDGADWHFSIADNGQGFEPRYADRIFGVFKRLHGADVPGTGIGLAVCKRIVERHGGRIWAEAEPGVGAIFHFTIGCGL